MFLGTHKIETPLVFSTSQKRSLFFLIVVVSNSFEFGTHPFRRPSYGH